MNEQQTRKGDFTPKYYNSQAILDDEKLQPAEQLEALNKELQERNNGK